jgi:hypothetical protein
MYSEFSGHWSRNRCLFVKTKVLFAHMETFIIGTCSSLHIQAHALGLVAISQNLRGVYMKTKNLLPVSHILLYVCCGYPYIIKYPHSQHIF